VSFRRDQTKQRRFNDWMREHRNSLLDIDVPLGVTEEEQLWSYFLEHAYDERSGWSVESLSRHSAKALLALLSEHGAAEAACILPTLRRLIVEKDE
jgi:hypothetical protein